MKLIVMILFILFSRTTYSQQKSVFYNDKGQLYLDTTLTITKAQYNVWSRAEFNLIAGFAHVKFPEIYVENNIKAKGVLIASFQCDTSDIKAVTILKDSSGSPGYAISVIKGLQDQGKSIANILKQNALNFSSNPEYLGKYYVAFDFMLIDFYQQLNNRKAVPVIRGSIPLIDVGMH
jgi:hypothetical protein